VTTYPDTSVTRRRRARERASAPIGGTAVPAEQSEASGAADADLRGVVGPRTAADGGVVLWLDRSRRAASPSYPGPEVA
jgi:hypothetical protein